MTALKKPIFCSLFMILALTLIQCGGKSKGFSLADRSGGLTTSSNCTKLMKKRKYDKAIKCFEDFRASAYGSTGIARADLAIADAYFANKDYLIAKEAYNLFSSSYPQHPKAPYAFYRSALSEYKNAPKAIDRDFGNLDTALDNLAYVMSVYPGTEYGRLSEELTRKIRHKMASKEFYIGRFYYRYNEYLAAIPRFIKIANDYPQAGLENQTYFYLIKALKKTKQNELANQYFEVFKQFYPDHKNAIKKIAGLF